MNKYGRAWQRIRNRYARSHPTCEICGKPTEEIHHIIPLCEGGRHNEDNLMALCSVCHARIHIYLSEVENRGISKSPKPL